MSTHYSTFSSILYLTSVGLFGWTRKNVGQMSSIANIFEYRYIFFSTLKMKKKSVYKCIFIYDELIKFRSILVLLRQILLKDAVHSTVLSLIPYTKVGQVLFKMWVLLKLSPTMRLSHHTCTRLIKQLRLI